MASPQKEDGFVPISNELIEAFAQAKIPSDAWRILFVIIRKTYGFNKKTDVISASQFSILTGLSRRSVFRAIAHLSRSKMIITEFKGITKPQSFSVAKDYEAWIGVFHRFSTGFSTDKQFLPENDEKKASASVKNDTSPMCATSVKIDTHKIHKKTKESSILYGNKYKINNLTGIAKWNQIRKIKAETHTLKSIGWDMEKIKENMLSRGVPECIFDEAIGKKW